MQNRTDTTEKNQSQIKINGSSVLENPIWNALSSAHETLAEVNGMARRYAKDVSPLVGLEQWTPEAFNDLRKLVAVGEHVGLLTPYSITIPQEWQVLLAIVIDQMICEELVKPNVKAFNWVELTEKDASEMLTLAQMTKPGPFAAKTIKMGRYIGVRTHDGQLVAMAGHRLTLDNFVEISGVCTDPQYCGQGFAKGLVAILARDLFKAGKIPFLHVKTQNEAAKAVYKRLGFKENRPIHFTMVTPKEC